MVIRIRDPVILLSISFSLPGYECQLVSTPNFGTNSVITAATSGEEELTRRNFATMISAS